MRTFTAALLWAVLVFTSIPALAEGSITPADPGGGMITPAPAGTISGPSGTTEIPTYRPLPGPTPVVVKDVDVAPVHVTRVTKTYPTTYVTVEKNLSYRDKVARIDAVLATARKVRDDSYPLGYRMVTTYPESQLVAQVAAENDRIVNLYPGVPDYGFKLKPGLPEVVIAAIYDAPAYAARKMAGATHGQVQEILGREVQRDAQIQGLAKSAEEGAVADERQDRALTALKGRADKADESGKALTDWQTQTGKRLDRHGISLTAIGFFLLAFLILGAVLWAAATPAVPNAALGCLGALGLVFLVAMAVLATLYIAT